MGKEKNVDGREVYHDFDNRMKFMWLDRSKPFPIPLQCYPENKKLVIEVVKDYASDRNLKVVFSNVAPAGRSIKKKGKEISYFYAYFTEK